MPLPLIPEFTDPTRWNERAGEDAPTPWQDSFGASAELGLSNTGMAAIGDLYLKRHFSEIEGQRTLSIEELNQKYNDLGIGWTRPEKEHVAEYVATEHRRRNALQRRIEMSAGGAGQSVMNFIGQMIPLAPEAMAGGLGVRGALMSRGVFAGESFAARAGMSFAENAIGTVPTELMVGIRDAQFEHDISLTDSLTNIVAGGFLGVGIEGVRAGWGKYRGTERVRAAKDLVMSKLKPAERAQVVEVAAANLAEGRKPMLSPLLNIIGQQMDGKGPRPEGVPAAQTNTFVNHGSEEGIRGTFFSGFEGRVEELGMRPPGEGVSEGTNFGPGLTGTSDLFHANAQAVPHGGVVHQFDLVNGRFAPVDEPIPGALRKPIADFLLDEMDGMEKLGGAIENGEPVSLREVYDNLTPEAAAALSQRLSNEGYQGLHGIEGDIGAERNFVHIFPESAPEVVAPGPALEHDPRFVKQPSPEEWKDFLEKYHAKENELFHAPDVEQKIQEKLKRAEETDYDDPTVADEHLAETETMAKQLAKEGRLTPEGQAMLEEFKEPTKTPKGEKVEEPTIAEEMAEELDEGKEPIPAAVGSVDQVWRDPGVEVPEFMKGLKVQADHTVGLKPGEARLYQATEFRRPTQSIAGNEYPTRGHGSSVGEPFVIRMGLDETIYAYDANGQEITHIVLAKGNNGRMHTPYTRTTREGWDGSGVGGALYREANMIAGGQLRPDAKYTTSRAAWKSWQNNLPDNLKAWVQETAEAFVKRRQPRGRWTWDLIGSDGQVARIGESMNELDPYYEHVAKEVQAAINAIRNGEKYNPEWANRVPMRLAPDVPGMPAVPADGPRPLVERVKEGEKIIKSLYNCLGAD